MSDPPVSTVDEMNFLERNLLGVPIRQAHQLLPGLLLAGFIAWLSLWLKDFIGTTLLGLEVNPISPIIIALLIGMTVGNVVPLPDQFTLGINFVMKKMLRLGII
ncbi:MAG: putative sulfate exporter family transporter, partial [Candidatus Ranarchaeia archaeon]